MKLTFRAARIDKQGKHNDRNFDVDKAQHIDQSKSHLNEYWTYNGNTIDSLADIEREFYEEHFSEHLQRANKKKEDYGNKNRTQTMDQYRTGRTRPEDIIIQIGDINEHVTGEQLWEVVTDYAEKFDKRYGNNCKILNMSMHLDEATPHVHIRRVWIAHDEDGLEFVHQEKALDEMGVIEPDINAPDGPKNNKKMSFTQEDRDILEFTCREHDIDIEFGEKGTRKYKNVNKFKESKFTEAIESIERVTGLTYSSVPEMVAGFDHFASKIEDIVGQMENSPMISLDEIEAARKKKNLAERFEYYMNIINACLEKVREEESIERTIHRSINEKIKDKFIKHEGLEEKYKGFEQKYLDRRGKDIRDEDGDGDISIAEYNKAITG